MRKVQERLQREGLRVELDSRDEKSAIKSVKRKCKNPVHACGR